MSGALARFASSVWIHLKVAMRQRVALFFTFLFPVGMLFLYLGLFYRGDPVFIPFGMAPLLTITVMGNAMFGMTFTLVGHRERGVLRQYRLAPVSPLFLVVQNVVVGTLLVLPTVLLQVGLAALFFGFRPGESWPLALVILVCGTMGFLGISSVVAAVASNMQQAHILANLFWFPFLFLSGATIPFAMLPSFMKTVSLFLPPTYLIEALTGLFTRTAPAASFLPHAAALLATAAAGCLLATRLFRWDKNEKLPARRKAWGAAVLVPILVAGVQNAAQGRMVQRMEKSWKDAASQTDTTLLSNVTLVDGTGRAPLHGAAVLIRGRKIEAVLPPGSPRRKTDRVVDLGGKFVIPGLIDVHVHVGGSGALQPMPDQFTQEQFGKNLMGYLLCGVTTVRSVGDADAAVFSWRERSERGEVVAPRILAAGPAFTARGGHPVPLYAYSAELVESATRQVDTPAQARTAVAGLLARNPDVVKAVYDGGAEAPEGRPLPKLSRDCLAALVAEAHRAGRMVVVHATTAADVADAVALGADGIEHGAHDAMLPPSLVREIARRRVAYDATLPVLDFLRIRDHAASVRGRLEDPLVRTAVAPGIRAASTDGGMGAMARILATGRTAHAGGGGSPRAAAQRYETAARNLRAVAEAGGMIPLGTDAGNPAIFHGPSVHRALSLMVACGLSPTRALSAATRDAAEALGRLSDLGTVEAGKSADLVVLDGDPLEDIGNARKISAVFRAGVEVDLAALATAIAR